MRTVMRSFFGMRAIHFCDDDGRPLCDTANGDEWLWTAIPNTVTCPECCALLLSLDNDGLLASESRKVAFVVDGDFGLTEAHG